MGFDNNLADYINQNSSSAEATIPDAPFVNKRRPTIPVSNTTLNPTKTSASRISTPSQPSYSFPQSSRLPPSKSKSQPSLRSSSPNKPAGSSVKETHVSKPTTQSLPAKPKPLTKPASPLNTFQFGSQSAKPTTSNVTVTTSGGISVSDMPDIHLTLIPSSHSSVTDTEPTIAEVPNPSIPKPSSQMTGFDTIVEGNEVDHPINTRGNTSSYNESPMAKLLEEYMTEINGNSLSMEATVVLLVTMDELKPDHIMTIENRNKGTTKYKLVNSLLDDLSKTAVELQVFVEKASSLIEERSCHFTVDPKDTLLQILRGTTSLPQLNVAWKTMQRRLELGHKTLQKYVQEYQNEPNEQYFPFLH